MTLAFAFQANSGIRRQPFLGNQLKPVASAMSSAATATTTTTSSTPSSTISATTSTTSAQTTLISTATAMTNTINTNGVPTRTPRRASTSGSSSRSSSPVKTVHLDPIQELLSQHQQIVGNKSSSAVSQIQNQNSVTNANRQNGTQNGGGSVSVSNNYSSGQHHHRIRRESSGTLSSASTAPTQGRAIPQTPTSREKSLNLKNTGSSGSNNNSSELVSSGNNQRQLLEHSTDLDSADMIENNNGKKVRPKSFWASWWRF